VCASYIDCPERVALLKIAINSTKVKTFLHISSLKPEWIHNIDLPSNVVVVVDQGKQSQFEKIKTLLPIINTEYVAFIDDDDILSPDICKHYEQYLLDNKQRPITIRPWALNNPFEEYMGDDWSHGYPTNPDFCGLLCSTSIVRSFVHKHQTVLKSGTADGVFVSYCINNSRVVEIADPQVFYRTWKNPRSWRL